MSWYVYFKRDISFIPPLDRRMGRSKDCNGLTTGLSSDVALEQTCA